MGAGAAAKRQAVATGAKQVMKDDFACERLPEFMAAVNAMVDAGYPSWYKQAFFMPAPVKY